MTYVDNLPKKIFWQDEYEQINTIDMTRLEDTYKKAYAIFSHNQQKYFNNRYSLHPLINSNNTFLKEESNNLLISVLTICFFILNNYKNVYILINKDFFSSAHHKNNEQNSYLPFFIDINPSLSFMEVFINVKNKINLYRENYIELLNRTNDLPLKHHRLEIQITFPSHVEKDTSGILFHINQMEKLFCQIKMTTDVHDMALRFIKEYLKNIMLTILHHPEVKIYDISILSRIEQKKILEEWSGIKKTTPLQENVIEIIQNHATTQPNQIALYFNEERITYQLLMNQVEAFSLKLNELGFEKYDRALIFNARSPQMIVSILSVLKSGGCYVPIDLKFPKEKIHFILKNSNTRFILTHKMVAPKLDLKEEHEKIAFKDHFRIIKLHNNVKKFKISGSPAYLIYTSGSTGEPKGVLVSHKNIINYSNWFIKSFNFTADSCIDFSSSISFDLAVSCTLMPLIAGGKILICNEGSDAKLSPERYLKNLMDHSITHVEWTPDYFHHALEYEDCIKHFSNLQWIMLGGDAIVKKDVEKCFALLPNIKVVNEYGPTECTVAITSYIIHKDNIDHYDDIIPIGKPAINTQAYILNNFLNLCPVGTLGELHIGGDSVCLGYLDKDQTEKKFIPNPFNHNEIMYKTGDIVCWLPDGNIHFVGRIDDQVKIRGHRVEIGEIEKTVLKHKLIAQCKILVQCLLQGEKILVCYIVPVKGGNLTRAEMRAYLQDKLPEFMIPNRFIFLDVFPTNVNGKVDLKSLQKLNDKFIESESDIFIENTSFIDKIRFIWCKAFGLSSINVNDNFFELGGNSLTALNIITQIKNHLHLHLNTNSIFLYPSIQALYDSIRFNLNKFEFETEKLPIAFCLSRDNHKKPLIFIHPVGGSIFLFNLLAKKISDTFTVYALQDPGIEDPSIRFESLEEMASLYIDSIKMIQKKGPYCIAGASFGATLAIEIAEQLSEKEEEVEWVGLFDGWAAYPTKFNNRKFFNDFMFERMPNLDSSYALDLLEMQYSREMLLQDYKIKSTHLNLNLFKAKEIWPVFQEIDTVDNGWKAHFGLKVALYPVPGDHESMFHLPNVNTLAEAIKKSLSKANEN